MTSNGKRKREEYESSDEEPSLGKQVLPIANLPDDFDGVPMDGSQYLFTVRRDSRLLPHTTRVANPYELNLDKPESTSTAKTILAALPSEEWRATVERRFKNFRQNVVQPTIHVARPLQSKIMPDKKNRDSWWAFIEGRPEAEWNPPKKSKARNKYGRGMRGFSEERGSDYQERPSGAETWKFNEEGEVELAVATDLTESLPTPGGTPVPPDTMSDDLPSEISQRRREPTPSLLQYIDDRMSLHLLMYFTHWITVHLEQSQPSRITETHARWIFGLLSRVGDFVSADDMNLLRNLARACLSMLKFMIQRRMKIGGIEELRVLAVGEKSQESMGERSCWIIVSVIIGVWTQRDLWMDAEEIISAVDG